MSALLSEITHINFGILSADEIRRNAVCTVTNADLSGPNSVYDDRMGVTDSGKICPTCGMTNRFCPGHYGCIKLARPIFHPMYYRHTVSMLNIFCSYCSRLYVTPEHLALEHLAGKYDRICAYISSVSGCMYCASERKTYSFNSTDCAVMCGGSAVSPDTVLAIFASVVDSDVRLLGIRPELMRPRSLVMEYIVVIPTKSRPYVISDGTTCDDDMTVVYQTIVRNNEKAVADKNKLSSIIFLVTTLMNNSDGRSKHNNGGRPIKGIKERISGKDGIIRNNMSGKRVNQSARTVIGPDPTLQTGQVAVPAQIARTLTVPEHVNSRNIVEMQRLVDAGRANYVLRGQTKINLEYALWTQPTEILPGDTVLRNGEPVAVPRAGDTVCRGTERVVYEEARRRTYTLQTGDTVERQLRDGDIILINRQPTLHKCSMLAKRVVVRPGKTMRLNLAATKVFNADFDGDEMNIHVPQDYVARAELAELAATDRNLISAQSSRPHIVVVQDGLLGAYLMTKHDYAIPPHIFFDMCMRLVGIDTARVRAVARLGYVGRALVSLTLPPDFSFRAGDVVVERGLYLSGALTKSAVAALVHTLHRDTGHAISFIDNIQFAAYSWLMHFGFSIGLGDCIPPPGLQEQVQRAVAHCFAEAAMIKDSVRNERIRSAKIAIALAKARDKGMRLAKDSLQPDNGFVATVTSGSKGDFFNVCQITGLLGQQNVSGRHIQPVLNEGTRALPHFPPGHDDFAATGFVSHSFIHGLQPHEYFFHAMSGREGVSDTALKTAVSGYTQRKMVKLMEDIQVRYDGTVRNSAGEIIQWEYAGDGLDRTRTILHNNETRFCDIARLADRLNARAET